MIDKAALLAELAAARTRLSETGSVLRQKLDLPARAREGFSRHRSVWLGGAALLGLILSKLPPRRRTVFVEKTTGKALGAAGKLGLVWSAAKLAFDVARPFVYEFASKNFGEIARRFGKAAKSPGAERPTDGP
jgi:hypothetical protein